jgi:hypothetical protein
MDIPIHFAEGLSQFNFDLGFDPSLLQVVRVEEGDFLSQGGHNHTLWTKPQVDNENGVIRNVTCRLMGKSEGGENTGVLATVTFKSIQTGNCDVGLHNLRLLDENGRELTTRTQGSVVVFAHGTISGTVRDAESQLPIASADIEVSKRISITNLFRRSSEQDDQIGRLTNNAGFQLATFADREGNYIITGVPTGKFEVTASTRTYLYSIPSQAQVNVTPGCVITNVDLEIDPRPPLPSRASAVMPESPFIDQPAPDFTLKDLDGNSVALADFKGKPVIINFWAPW